MGEDASLDQFLTDESDEQCSVSAEEPKPTASEAGGEQSETDGAETAADDETEPDPAAATDTVEPAATTYAWSGEGTACEACGEVVERRWQQEGGLVCIECKDWEQA